MTYVGTSVWLHSAQKPLLINQKQQALRQQVYHEAVRALTEKTSVRSIAPESQDWQKIKNEDLFLQELTNDLNEQSRSQPLAKTIVRPETSQLPTATYTLPPPLSTPGQSHHLDTKHSKETSHEAVAQKLEKLKNGQVKKYFNTYSEAAWIEENELKILAEQDKKDIQERQAIAQWPQFTPQELEEIAQSQLKTLTASSETRIPLAIEPICKRATELIQEAHNALNPCFDNTSIQKITELKTTIHTTLLSLESIIEREKPYNYFLKKYTQQVIHKLPITDPKKLYTVIGITVESGRENYLETLMPLIKEEILEREFRHIFNNNPFGKENYDAFVQGEKAVQELMPTEKKLKQLKKTYEKLRKALFDVAVTFRV